MLIVFLSNVSKKTASCGKAEVLVSASSVPIYVVALGGAGVAGHVLKTRDE